MIAPNGILFENSAVTMAAITDGSSQTVAISETIRSTDGSPTGLNAQTVFPRDPLAGFVLTGNNSAGNGPPITDDASYVSQCLSRNPPSGFQLHAGRQVALTALQGTACTTTGAPPTSKRYDCRGGLPHSDKSCGGLGRTSPSTSPRGAGTPAEPTRFSATGTCSSSRDSINVAAWQGWGAATAAKLFRPTPS